MSEQLDGIDPQIEEGTGDILVGFSTARHTMQALRLTAAEACALGGKLGGLGLKSAMTYPKQAEEMKRFRKAMDEK